MPNFPETPTAEPSIEAEADRLACPPGRKRGEGPFTERQLMRRSRRTVAGTGIEELAEACSQGAREELQFLASVSRLSPGARALVRLWADGCTQAEIAKALGTSQQTISNRLRPALARCYENVPVSFREYSRRFIYRAPKRRNSAAFTRICPRCQEHFAAACGAGRFCSGRCQEAATAGGRPRNTR